MLLAVGTIALAALHLWIGRNVSLPGRGPGDQWGYFGSARFLAGEQNTYVMPFFPYFTYGYSLVLAPAVRFIDDPGDLFLAIKIINATLAASVLPLLFSFGRCLLGASRAQALAGAIVGSLVPPLVAHPTSILAENLVLPLAIATMLAGWLFLTERPTWQRLLFGPAMVWLHLGHNRFAAALPLFALLLVLGARTRLAPVRIAAYNAGSALALLVLAQAVRNAIVEARWTYGIKTPQGPASDAVEVLTDRHLLQEYLLVAVGQAWYLAAGTLGLAVIGLWAVIRRIAAREAPTGPTTSWDQDLWRDPAKLTLAFLVATAAAVFATSTYFFTRVANGSEGFIAGRHNDTFVPMWVAAGVALLLRTPSAKRWWAPTIAGGVTAGLTVVLFWGRRGGGLAHVYSMLNVPAIAHQGAAGESVVQHAAAIAIGALLFAALVTRVGIHPGLLLPFACAWLVGAVGSKVGPDPLMDGWAMPEQVERLDVETASAVQQDRVSGMPVHYPYFLPSVRFIPWDLSGEPPSPIVIADLDSALGARGGRVAMIDEPIRTAFRRAYAVALWVLPGADQDRLAADGALLPPAFPSALPVEARMADLAVDDEVVQADGGGSVSLRVRGHHAGSGSPWPDRASAGTEGTVHLVARSVSSASDGPAPALQEAELPGWIRPGDTFEVELELPASDADGRPLPPGRYEIAVGLAQRDFGAFSSPGDEPLVIVLEVS